MEYSLEISTDEELKKNLLASAEKKQEIKVDKEKEQELATGESRKGIDWEQNVEDNVSEVGLSKTMLDTLNAQAEVLLTPINIEKTIEAISDDELKRSLFDIQRNEKEVPQIIIGRTVLDFRNTQPEVISTTNNIEKIIEKYSDEELKKILLVNKKIKPETLNCVEGNEFSFDESGNQNAEDKEILFGSFCNEKEVSENYQYPKAIFKLLFQKELQSIVNLHQNRKQNRVIIITDERTVIDLSNLQKHVTVLTIPGFKLSRALTSIKLLSCFGKGTAYIIVCGTHDLLLSVPLQECLDSKDCCKAVDLFKLAPFSYEFQFLIQKALQLNYEILNSTENDIVLFSALFPVDINQENKFRLKMRICHLLHNIEPLLPSESTLIKKYVSAAHCFNNFANEHAQALGFKPLNLTEYNFWRKKTRQYEILDCQCTLCPDEYINLAKELEIRCLELIETVIRQNSPPKVIASENVVVAREISKDNCILTADSGCVKFSCPSFVTVMPKIIEMQKGRVQNNIVIVTDNREAFDVNLSGYDQRVTVVKIPHLNYNNALRLIEKNPNFGKDTIFVFSCGTHDLIHRRKVNDCVNFKCLHPVTELYLCLSNFNLVGAALKLNIDLFLSTKNDIALFCELLPVDIGNYHNYYHNRRQCIQTHPLPPLPKVKKEEYEKYLNAIEKFNSFANYHARILTFSSWNLVTNDSSKQDFNKSLIENGYNIRQPDKSRRAEIAKKRCSEMIRYLSAKKKGKNSLVKSTVIKHNDSKSTSALIVIEHNDSKSASAAIVIEHNDSKLTSALTGIEHNDSKSTSAAIVIEQIDSKLTSAAPVIENNDFKSTSAAKVIEHIDSKSTLIANNGLKITKYDLICFITDQQYMPFIKEFSDNRVSFLFTDQKLEIEDLEKCLLEQKNILTPTTLYLLVNGIHYVTNVADADMCLKNDCKEPIPTLIKADCLLNENNLKNLSNFNKERTKTMHSVVEKSSRHIPQSSNLAILPPVPVSYIQLSNDHHGLHEQMKQLPYRLVCDNKIGIIYRSWIPLISSMSISSIKKCTDKKTNELIGELHEFQNFRESKTSSEDLHDLNMWKNFVREIISVSLKDQVSEKLEKSDVGLDSRSESNETSNQKSESTVEEIQRKKIVYDQITTKPNSSDSKPCDQSSKKRIQPSIRKLNRVSSEPRIIERISIPAKQLATISGVGGATLKYLSETSGAIMSIIRRGSGNGKSLKITGNPHQVEMAKKLVYDLLSGLELPLASSQMCSGTQEFGDGSLGDFKDIEYTKLRSGKTYEEYVHSKYMEHNEEIESENHTLQRSTSSKERARNKSLDVYDYFDKFSVSEKTGDYSGNYRKNYNKRSRSRSRSPTKSSYHQTRSRSRNYGRFSRSPSSSHSDKLHFRTSSNKNYRSSVSDKSRSLMLGRSLSKEHVQSHSSKQDKPRSSNHYQSGSLEYDNLHSLRYDTLGTLKRDRSVSIENYQTNSLKYDSSTTLKRDTSVSTESGQTKFLKYDSSRMLKRDRSVSNESGQTKSLKYETSRMLKRDRSVSIESDQTKSLKYDSSGMLKRDRSVSIESDQTKSLKYETSRMLKRDRSVSIESDQTKSLKYETSRMLKRDRSVSIESNQTNFLKYDSSSTLKRDQAMALKLDSSKYAKHKRKSETVSPEHCGNSHSNHKKSAKLADAHQCWNTENKLRKQLGAELFEKYEVVLRELRHSFEEEFSVYKHIPEFHPNYESHYAKFVSEQPKNMNGHHLEKLWKLHWKDVYEHIKDHDWKEKQECLMEEYSKKVKALVVKIHHNDRTKETLQSNNEKYCEKLKVSVDKHSSSPHRKVQSDVTDSVFAKEYSSPSTVSKLISFNVEKECSFNFEKALTLIESVCDKVLIFGSSIKTMVSISRNFGVNSKEAYNVFTELENVTLLNLFLDKVKDLSLSATDYDAHLFKKVIECIPKLLEEAKNGPTIKSFDLNAIVDCLDLNAIARVSMGESPDFTIELINSALAYEGIQEPPLEVINHIYLKVCNIHFTIAKNT